MPLLKPKKTKPSKPGVQYNFSGDEMVKAKGFNPSNLGLPRATKKTRKNPMRSVEPSGAGQSKYHS